LNATVGEGWTVARVEHVRVRWCADGASAGVIGRELGVSRNAVIGKVFRLGWQQYAASAPREELPRRRAQPQTRVYQRPASQPLPAFASADGIDTAIPFINRTARNCPFCVEPALFPASPEMMVCGAYVPPGEVWCKAHRAIVLVPQLSKVSTYNPDRNVVYSRPVAA
jgi:GcrA cell cycle regulator